LNAEKKSQRRKRENNKKGEGVFKKKKPFNCTPSQGKVVCNLRFGGKTVSHKEVKEKGGKISDASHAKRKKDFS